MKNFRVDWDFAADVKKIDEYCKLLQLPQPFTSDELKSAFRAAALKAHSDAGGNDKEFIRVKEAYEYLQAFTSEELSQEEVEAAAWKRIEIEEQEPFKNFVDCDRCGGQGRWTSVRETGGYGFGPTPCPKCGGDGKYKLPCRACNGTGKFTQRSGRVVDCRKCEGTGKFPVGLCYACGETGTIPGLVWEPAGKETVKNECPSCEGTGKKEILNPVLKKGVISRSK